MAFLRLQSFTADKVQYSKPDTKQFCAIVKPQHRLFGVHSKWESLQINRAYLDLDIVFNPRFLDVGFLTTSPSFLLADFQLVVFHLDKLALKFPVFPRLLRLLQAV